MTTYAMRPRPSPLGNMTQQVKGQINQFAGSGQYYVTPEMSHELRKINHGVEHIKLDHDFLHSSNDWAERWNRDQTAAQCFDLCESGDGFNIENATVDSMSIRDAARAIQDAAVTIDRLREPLEARTISGRQDNQVRQQHHTAVQALKATNQDLSPFANQSVDRIKQYCDHIGVTDRFTGYKSNLNRGSRDPVRLGYKWLDKDRRNAGFRTARSAGACAVKPSDPRAVMSARGPMERMDPLTCNSMQKPATACSKSVQEQCGINTVFPGRTEYMVRYTRPPLDRPIVPFTINPTPNTGAHGRPQAQNSWFPNNTEYQWRYEWPDGNKIDKLPWIKKF